MREIDHLMTINRSITGDGVRESLRYLQEESGFQIKEIPSGTKVFGWEVPNEWRVNEAVIRDERGEAVVDVKDDFLHLVGYSRPFRGVLTLDELKPHLHSDPLRPWVTPYKTSYYNDAWGFCLPQNQLESLKSGYYTVVVDTDIYPGSLTYGEEIVGNKGKEFMISTYCCHPNMVNDNTAGMVLWSKLLEHVKGKDLNNTYRFVIAPETIGMISYLAQNQEQVANVEGAFVVTHVVGKGEVQFKKSFLGNSYIDRVARQVIKTETEFDIRGSDERQLSSYPFKIPTIVITKGGLYQHDYHSSADRVFNQDYFNETLETYKQVIDLLEEDKAYVRTSPCEPMLSKHGLYPTLGGSNHTADNSVLLWTSFFSDGSNSALNIAEKSGKPMPEVVKASKMLLEKGLIA